MREKDRGADASGAAEAVRYAKAELRSYVGLCAARENLRDRLALCEGGAGVGGGMQAEVLRAELTATETMLRVIERGLAVLDDEERVVLEGFYLRRAVGHVERLCERLSVERPTVYRMARRALQRYALAAYGTGAMRGGAEEDEDGDEDETNVR